MSSPRFAVILPAAGRSTRFGGKEKKPFVTLDNRAVWIRSAELFVNRPDVAQIILVIDAEARERVKQKYGANLMFMEIHLVDGGKERFESVENALKVVKPEIDYVIVHDAVRPCVPSTVIDATMAAAVKGGAALPGISIADTLKRVDSQLKVTATVPRDGLWQAQTPQIFRKDLLLEAYARRASLGANITDDAQLVEALGHPVQMVPGSPMNLKITRHEDLKLASLFVKARDAEAAATKPLRAFDDERFM
jgi:2-C-methyl-D-erythritol 4-phosphate cytidylyltransferase